MAVTTTGDETPRARNLLYTYRNSDGTIVSEFTPKATGVIVTPSNGIDAKGETIPYSKSLECSGGDLFKDKNGKSKDVPEGTGRMALLFGIKTTVGNAVTGLKKDEKADPEKVLETITNRWENIKDGDWREGREGGPQLKYVLAAVCTIIAAGQGSPVDAAQEAAVKAELIKTGTKAWLDQPDVKAEFDAQAAARLAKQAADSAQIAASAKGKPSLVTALLKK